MTAKRTPMHRLQELVRLHRLGQGARAVARQLQISPTTERQYRRALEAAGLLAGGPDDLPEVEELKAAIEARLPRRPPPQQVSTASPWQGDIERLLAQGAGPRAIHDWLTLHVEGFDASYSAIKRLCRRVRRKRPVQADDVVIPVETKPGEVAQVDFGYVGRLWDPARGERRKAWVFVMVLGHSRHQFARVVFHQDTATWLRLHVEAFLHFGGVPAVVVPDNLKAAVIRAAFGQADQESLNRSYVELARYYGFRVDPTPPRAPEKKGKVESGVKYVKNNFFKTCDAETLDAVNIELDRWVAEIAGQRRHGSTGRQPLAVFESEERGALRPLPIRPFVPVVWKEAKVHVDSHVQFDGRLYSVPWRHLGKRVWVRATPTAVDVFFDGARIANHARRGTSRRSTQDQHLPDHRVDYRHREPEWWVRRAARMGDEVGVFIEDVFAADDVVLQLRTAIQIVKLLEKHPVERARAACRRARFYGNHTYLGVRDILRQGLDMQPLPEELPGLVGRLEAPRFARPPRLFPPPHGGTDEYH